LGGLMLFTGVSSAKAADWDDHPYDREARYTEWRAHEAAERFGYARRATGDRKIMRPANGQGISAMRTGNVVNDTTETIIATATKGAGRRGDSSDDLSGRK